MFRFLAGLAAAALALSCAQSSPPAAIPQAHDDAHPLVGYEAHFFITWNGARIGDASELLRSRGDDALRFERRERITVRRGEALAHSETQLVIDTDGDLKARRVTIRQISSGVLRHGEAVRNSRGDWEVTFASEPVRLIPGAAVPAELVPLLVASRQQAEMQSAVRFDGQVMLPGYGFATARLRVSAAEEQRLIATLSTPNGSLQGQFFLSQSGAIARVQSDDGTGAVRVQPAMAAEPFAPPELVDAASLAIVPPASSTGAIAALVIEPVPPERPLPPALPGQHIEARAGAWLVQLGAGDSGAPLAAVEPMPELPADLSAEFPAHLAHLPGDPAMAELAARILAQARPSSAHEEVAALVRAASELLEDDLGAPGVDVHAALALGRGDCTAHTLVFAGLAQARGIPIRLVTGYRLDDDRLVRHRWALAAVDGVWVAVDPTHGEAPAAPRLIGLAVHGPLAADLALADDVAFAGLTGARAHACEPGRLSDQPCGRSRPRTR